MTCHRTFGKIILTVVLLALVLHICFSLISASPASAAEQTKDEQIAALEQEIQRLNLLVEELSADEDYVLMLRVEQVYSLGELKLMVLQIPVDKELYESCRIGDDITTGFGLHLMASSYLSETRVFVEDKYIITR